MFKLFNKKEQMPVEKQETAEDKERKNLEHKAKAKFFGYVTLSLGIMFGSIVGGMKFEQNQGMSQTDKNLKWGNRGVDAEIAQTKEWQAEADSLEKAFRTKWEEMQRQEKQTAEQE